MTDTASRSHIPQDLLLRLITAESESRRSRRLSVLALIGTTAVLGIAAALVVVYARAGFPGTIRQSVDAQNFVLRDAHGTIRGMFGLTSEGEPRLLLKDIRGRDRISVALMADGSTGLVLADSAGHSRAVLGLLADETATMAFADRNGRTRTVLGLAPDESSTLVFADRLGKTQSGFGVDANGHPAFSAESEMPASPPDTAAP